MEAQRSKIVLRVGLVATIARRLLSAVNVTLLALSAYPMTLSIERSVIFDAAHRRGASQGSSHEMVRRRSFKAKARIVLKTKTPIVGWISQNHASLRIQLPEPRQTLAN